MFFGYINNSNYGEKADFDLVALTNTKEEAVYLIQSRLGELYTGLYEKELSSGPDKEIFYRHTVPHKLRGLYWVAMITPYDLYRRDYESLVSDYREARMELSRLKGY